MKYKIDITMTACMRPELLEVTLSSFFKNMFNEYREAGNELNLIINIDRTDPNYDLKDIKGLFSHIIVGRFDNLRVKSPSTPSFPRAFKRVWSSVHDDTNYVFNLEDDWELLRPVNLLDMVNILESEPDLAILRLAAFHAGEQSMKNWNKFFPYNGEYYECPKDRRTSLGFCGHPSLIKAEFVRNMTPFLNDVQNPEKQFHNRRYTKIMEEIVNWRYGVFSVPETPPLIRDIGRRWMVDNGYKKKGAKAFFTEWERVKNDI